MAIDPDMGSRAEPSHAVLLPFRGSGIFASHRSHRMARTFILSMLAGYLAWSFTLVIFWLLGMRRRGSSS